MSTSTDHVLLLISLSIQSYDILPSTDIKSKNIKDREARALLSGVSKKGHGDSIQGSILLPNASNEEEVRVLCRCRLRELLRAFCLVGYVAKPCDFVILAV